MLHAFLIEIAMKTWLTYQQVNSRKARLKASSKQKRGNMHLEQNTFSSKSCIKNVRLIK